MLAGTKKISAASENAAVRPRLSAGCPPMTDPQRKHSAAVPGCSASIRCSRPQVLQAMTDSTSAKPPVIGTRYCMLALRLRKRGGKDVAGQLDRSLSRQFHVVERDPGVQGHGALRRGRDRGD